MKKLGIILAVVLFSLVAFAQEVDLEVLQNRVDLLEEYSNMIYDSLGTKLSVDDFDVAMAGLDERLGALETNVLNLQGTINDGLPALRDMIYELSANLSSLEERLTSYVGVSSDEAKAAAIEEALAEVNPVLDDIKVTLDIHDGDILKIYETLGNLSDELANLNDMVSELQPVSENLQALSLKVDMHDQDIVNLYDNLSTKADAEKVDALEATVTDLLDSIDGLSEIITGLGAQIGDTDYLLRKQIENLTKTVDANTAKIDELAKGTEENYGTLSDKVSLLEDYSNMIYDTVNTKAAQEDVAQLQETVDNNTAKIDQLEKSLNEANAKVQQAQLIGIAGIVIGVIAGIVGAMLP
ncbi:MAG TPA: hypothetical protein PLM21_06180 [Fervidobacterium sp.]|jgi:chromosome segregation ATPase|nr:hypothetical protein [Fervidobacterium sp.]HQG02264.1 hypothetical protein [Fervidobacterium sp.]HQI09927.1 hypothetical protein [Fervidobacterium sp.]HQI94163.1 hypothetical protein [Fervidobacterium sp.]